jgi:hypothetical protein
MNVQRRNRWRDAALDVITQGIALGEMNFLLEGLEDGRSRLAGPRPIGAFRVRTTDSSAANG